MTSFSRSGVVPVLQPINVVCGHWLRADVGTHTPVTPRKSGGREKSWMSGKVFLDSSILVYAQDTGSADKQRRGRELIARLADSGDGVISRFRTRWSDQIS